MAMLDEGRTMAPSEETVTELPATVGQLCKALWVLTVSTGSPEIS
jgi:hypothetical protein